MKRWFVLVIFAALLLPLGIASAQGPSISRGGQLYDQWWKVVGAPAPTESHPLWANQTTNTRTGADTWRCKECHGWDYLGKDGAYGSGSHLTGFAGLFSSAQDKSVDELVAALKGSGNANHNFSTMMDDAALTDLANFVKTGVVDPRMYIDYATKKPNNADAQRGQGLYTGLCAGCHNADGKKYNFGSDAEPEFVGTIAVDNPQEFLHKARFGTPGSDPKMPATHDMGWPIQDVIDVMAYAQTLPTGAEPAAATSTTAAAPGVLPKTGAPLSPALTGLAALALSAGAWFVAAGTRRRH